MDIQKLTEEFVQEVYRRLERFPTVDEPGMSIIKEAELFEQQLWKFMKEEHDEYKEIELMKCLESASDICFAAYLFLYLFRPENAEEIFAQNLKKIQDRISADNYVGMMPPGSPMKLISYYNKEKLARTVASKLLKRI